MAVFAMEIRARLEDAGRTLEGDDGSYDGEDESVDDRSEDARGVPEAKTRDMLEEMSMFDARLQRIDVVARCASQQVQLVEDDVVSVVDRVVFRTEQVEKHIEASRALASSVAMSNIVQKI